MEAREVPYVGSRIADLSASGPIWYAYYVGWRGGTVSVWGRSTENAIRDFCAAHRLEVQAEPRQGGRDFGTHLQAIAGRKLSCPTRFEGDYLEARCWEVGPEPFSVCYSYASGLFFMDFYAWSRRGFETPDQ